MKTTKKVFRIILDILFKLVILFVCVVFITNYLGFKTYVVMSGSMEPNIHTGAIAIVYEKYDYDELQVDDVIAFKESTGAMVTHRIVSISDEGIETKGDANDISDGITTNKANYYGRTIYSIPNVGTFIVNAQNKFGQKNLTIMFVSVLVALILLNSLLSDDEEDNKNEKKNKNKNKKKKDKDNQLLDLEKEESTEEVVEEPRAMTLQEIIEQGQKK